MSLLTTEVPTDQIELGRLLIRADLPDNMDPRLGAEMLTAVADLLVVAQRILLIDALIGPRMIKSIRYGSAFEVLVVVAAAAPTVLIYSKAAKNILSGLSDHRLKLAKARMVIARTDAVRIDKARKDRLANWRLEEASPSGYIIEVTEERKPRDYKTVYSVNVAHGDDVKVYEFNGSEIDSLYLIQAERVVQDVAASAGTAELLQFQMTASAVRSLVILSQYDVTISVLTPEEEPHKHEA